MLIWSSKICQKDRLEEGFHKVKSALIVGMAVAGEDDRRMPVTRWPSRAPSRPMRVRARGKSENLGKNVEKSGNYFTEVRAISL